MSKKRQLSDGTAAMEVNGTDGTKEATEQKTTKYNKSREDMLKYVESRKENEPPFRLEYVRETSKKRKRSTTDDQKVKKLHLDGLEHESSFNTRLNCRYKILPEDNWLSMRPYKKFTLTHQNGEGTTTISVGDCVLVVNDPSLADTATADEAELWKAKVLQVRAIDAEHAYVLVAWLSRPEDMDLGRQPWHGADELIPTNQLDVIEALSVNGRINVRYFVDTEDTDDEGEFDSPNVDSAVRYFWRQTYDFANGGRYSALQKICIDKQPRNPDEVALQCKDPACGKWMHSHCLAVKAIKKAREYDSKASAAISDKLTGQDANMTKVSDKEIQPADDIPANAQAGVTDGHFTAHVYLANDGDDTIVDSEPFSSEILLFGPDKELERLSIVCLFCEHPVD